MMRMLWMFLLLWLSPLAQGVELVGQPEVTISGAEVTLTWKTDVASGTRVRYGLAPDKLDQKVEGAVTAVHEVTLKELQKGVTYHYTLGSARQRLHEGSFQIAATVPSTATTPSGKGVLDRMKSIFTPAPQAGPKSPAPEPNARPRAPPTQETWGRMDTLRDHYERHGPDFQSRSPDDYAAQAWHFLQRGRVGELPMKWDDSDGTLRVFDPKTRAFAAYNRDGTTKTFFRPGNPAYWQRQPGRLISPSNLPF